jgi:hypothetical protein
MMQTELKPAQVDAAYRMFYGEGKNLGEITKELGCGIYDLSPWLTAPALRIGREAREDASERIKILCAEIKRLEDANDRLTSRP